MELIDLRSDTVTQPTPAMREAMAKAQVGDDVYGEDPTINQLQDLAAELLGKEAGLLIPSGTMGNLAAILAHCNRGDEIILGDVAHTFLFEVGGIAALGGIHPHTVPNQPDGTIKLDHIRDAIRPEDSHYPITRLVTLENTHNRCGGASLSVEYTQAVADLARANDLILHLDGARIFNAAAALDVDVKELVEPVDSVTFCLSKALCAPVGSVLCGSKEFITRAHRMRKQLGGGMRQAGILAAAGIIALQEIVPRLGEDHTKARNLASGLSTVPGMTLDTDDPPSNMVYLTLGDEIPLDAREVAEKLEAHHVRVGVVTKRRFRLVTHYWIDDQAIQETIGAFEKVLGDCS
ncbi:MAG: low-specificity L-threonine aldolase [Anaerolineales bacterium]|nr:low-specificity L-threonine aldolase [Chloroflexota bacterium]MBL6981412.1 low-specificity L-threonine aldolase [Anaerolineales bacterium]